MTRLASTLALVLLFAPAARPDEPLAVPDAELLDELKSAPAENAERPARLRELYLQAGAKPEQVTTQAVASGSPSVPDQDNVIVVKKGKTDAVIVVGGHLDKVKRGHGVIDDWSGACLATNLFQALKDVETEHTFVFIGFAHEERGLLGSKHYVDSLDGAGKARIKAMVNLECLGVDGPYIWTNGSTDSMEAIAHKVADEHKLPLVDHEIKGVGADSMPFERVGIPVLTFDGLPLDKIRLIHSDNDTFDKIDPKSYADAYRIASRFLVALDKAAPPREEPTEGIEKAKPARSADARP